jgi:hypothetical protein
MTDGNYELYGRKRSWSLVYVNGGTEEDHEQSQHIRLQARPIRLPYRYLVVTMQRALLFMFYEH